MTARPAASTRVKSTPFLDRVLQMAPDERFKRASEGRIRFRGVDVPGDNYKRLQASECRVRGKHLACFGDDNEFFGDHVVAYGNRNVFHGSQCVAHGEDCRGNEAANKFYNTEGVPYNVPRAPPVPPAEVNARVEREIMPKEGDEPRHNDWKLSGYDIEGDSKPSIASRLDCVVCQTNGRDVIFEPCGHMACCRDCTRALANTPALAGRCPQCRAPVKYYLAIYY